MLEAGLWALLGQTSLVLGALLTIWFAVPRRLLGLVGGFGAGALVARRGLRALGPGVSRRR